MASEFLLPESWSPLSDIVKTYKKAQLEGQRERALKEIASGTGPLDENTARRLLAVDPQAAMSIAHLVQNSRDFGFRQQEANRAQGNVDRSFDFQKQQAEEQAKGFETREVDDGQGGKMLVRVNKQTGETTKVPIAGAADQPNNPYAYGKQNETQSKDSGYANRMFRAESVLRDPAIEGKADEKGKWVPGASTNLTENILGKAPGFVSNYLTGPDYQKFDQAKRDFVNAVLRRESGAAISQSEFDNAHKQYFPQPGDTPERISEKRRNRQDAIAGVAGGGGQTYKPPFTFGPDGKMVPTGNAAQGATPQQKPPTTGITKDMVQAARANPQQALAEAKEAIAKGVNPQAVAIRLQQVGINPALLTGEINTGFANPGQRQ